MCESTLTRANSFGDWLKDWRRDSKANTEELTALTARLEALHPDAREILRDLDDAWNTDTKLHLEWFKERLAQHAPCLAGLLDPLAQHLDETVGDEESCRRCLSAVPGRTEPVAPFVPAQGSGMVIHGVPARDSLYFVMAADGHTPVGLTIDGADYLVKPSRRRGGLRVHLNEGEHLFVVGEGGHIAAVRAAHIGLRRRARALGISVEGADDDPVPYGQRAAEIARLAGLITENENAAFRAPVAAVNVAADSAPTSPAGLTEIVQAAD